MNDLTDLSDLKAVTRKAAFAHRRAAHAADLAGDRAASRAAMDHFLAARLHTGAEIINSYARAPVRPRPE